MKNVISLFLLLFCTIYLHADVQLGNNLIQGATAESSSDINYWTQESGDGVLKIAPYSTGWVSQPSDAGNYFYYGTGGDSLIVYQEFDVSNLDDEIDDGDVFYTFRAYMGGYGDDDTINVKISFFKKNGNEISSTETGDFTTNKQMIIKTLAGQVPNKTRKIRFYLILKRVSNTDIDGYIDNISFVLHNELAAVNDYYSTPPDNPLTGNVLANDVGNDLNVTSHTDPQHGQLSIASNGDFTYIPDAGYIGTDSFHYTITDKNGATDTATVTITIETVFTEGVTMPFELVNPPSTRNIFGNFKIAGNTVLCLTEKTDGYGGTCHGDDDAYLTITSNMHVVKYLDIDEDPDTWDSTSSYIELPDSFDEEAGVYWAGLFWQGRISVDKDHPIRYAREKEGGGYELIEVGKGTNIRIDQFDIKETGATDIKLKINDNAYIDVIANTFHVFESNGGQTYAAYADVTNLFKNDTTKLKKGKNVFTVANLTTMEGREPSPGAFGGWALVIIYAENIDGGKPRNVSIYNGFISIGQNDDPIEISGFKLPKSGKVNAQVALFSGEGEYLYGRNPEYPNFIDWIKISNEKDGNYDYFSEVADKTGTEPGNRDNMFDAQLQNILRDDITVNGSDNNQSVNNVGIDVDFFDVSGIMTQYREENPSVNTIYLKTYSNDDYITPSMLAFATELYKPNLCYDYTFDIGGYVLDSTNNDINTSLHLIAPGAPLTTHLLIRSMEGDFTLENASFHSQILDPQMLRHIPGSVYISKYDITEYQPAGSLVYFENDQRFDLHFGDGATATKGGNVNAFQNYYFRFQSETNTSQSVLEAKFSFDANFTVDYGSGPVPVYYHFDENSRCPVSYTYQPEWGLFNVISDPDNPNLYNLNTQVTRRNFNAYGAYYTGDDFENNSVLDTKQDVYIEVELINANYFRSDTNASCHNPDSNITAPIFVKFPEDSGVTEPISIGNLGQKIPVDFAMRNTAFRVWFLEDENGTLVKPLCSSRTDDGCFHTLYTTHFTRDSLCQADCDGNHPGSDVCYACLRRYYGKMLCSRDNFSVRPDSFHITISDTDANASGAPLPFKTNIYVDVNTSIAMGYPYRLDINATCYDTTQAVSRYTRIYSPNFPDDHNLSILWAPLATINPVDCNDTSDKLSKRFAMWNGKNTDLNLSVDNVGLYLLAMRDSNWTYVDQNPTHHASWDQKWDCVQNSGITQPEGSTAMNGCDINTDDHFAPGLSNVTFKNIRLDVRPYRFGLYISKTIGNGHRGLKIDDWVYDNNLSNINDVNESVSFIGTIVAESYQGTRATNFTAGCYAKPIDLSLDYNTTPSTLPAAFEYRLADIHNDFNTPGQFVSLSDGNFTHDVPGRTSIELHMNIHRESNTTLNPVRITFGDFNVTCSPLNICQKQAHYNGAHNTVGTLSNGETVTFYYGRLHAPDYRTTENSVATPIYAEVYCDLPAAQCQNYGIDGNESLDDVNWWIFTEHNTTDGQIIGLLPSQGFSLTDPKISVSYSSTFINGVDPSVQVAYNGNSKPYKTRIFIQTASWLRYHPFIDTVSKMLYYDVTFLGTGNWSGVGYLDANATIQDVKGASQRIEW